MHLHYISNYLCAGTVRCYCAHQGRTIVSSSACSMANWEMNRGAIDPHHLRFGGELPILATNTEVGSSCVAGREGTLPCYSIRHASRRPQSNPRWWRHSHRHPNFGAAYPPPVMKPTISRRPAQDCRFPPRRRRCPRCRGSRPAVGALVRPCSGRTGSPPRSRARPGGRRALHRPPQRQRGSSFLPRASNSGRRRGWSRLGSRTDLRRNISKFGERYVRYGPTRLFGSPRAGRSLSPP